MSGIFAKLRDFVGFNEEEEYEYYEDENEYQTPYESESSVPTEEPTNRRRVRQHIPTENNMEQNKPNNVIGMPGLTNGVAEVVIVEPQSFGEMPQVIQTLRERRSVVLNLNNMPPEEAQRAVDFVAGGTYAMDGHQERIGESIFLFTPSCVKVSTLSGMIHDVPEIPETPMRHNKPNPNWSPDARVAAQ